MANDKELNIKIALDVKDVQVAAEIAKAAMQQAATAAEDLAFRKEQADRKAADRAATEAKRAADAQKRAAEAAALAYEENYRKASFGVNDLTAAFKNLAVQEIGLGSLVGLASNIGGVFKDAAERSRELARQIKESKENLTELAAIAGRKSDTAFTIETADFAEKTAMTAGEAEAFRKAFFGRGASRIGDTDDLAALRAQGKSIGKSEGAEFELKAGALAAAKGIAPDVFGDLAAAELGAKDYTRYGARGAETAAADLNRELAILSSGSGENAVLARHLSVLKSAMANEDELRGVFQGDEAAIAISTAAEAHDAQSSELARAAVRGLRDFKGKPAGALEAAGIDESTPFFDRGDGRGGGIEKLAAYYEREGAAKGVNVLDFLDQQGFTDELTKMALSVFINRGVGGSVIRDRRAAAAGAGDVDQLIADYQTDPDQPGIARISEAQRRKAELEKAKGRDRELALRDQALAELEKDPNFDSARQKAGDEWVDWANEKFTSGAATVRDKRIRQKELEILRRRAGEAGVQIADDVGVPFMEGAWEGKANQIMDVIEARGGNPLVDGAARREGPVGAHVDQKIVDQLERLNRTAERQAAGTGNPIPVAPGHNDRAR